ncbi:hypothetical protein [Chelonobacter oris]|nr:hypothetical protein [Chelonobacter oris]
MINKIDYSVFGRDLGVAPVYWETYLLGLGGREVSATSSFIEINFSKAVGKVIGNEVAKNVVIGSGLNATLQIAGGQPFNWYEFAGAWLSSAITPQMKIKTAIRTNMGIAMGISLVSGSDPLQGAGLAGAGTWLGSKFKNPIYSVLVSETIQKYPVISGKKYSSKETGGNDDQ